MNLINGRLLAEKIKDDIAKDVFGLCAPAASRRPSLAIILFGSRPDSELYVDLKQQSAEAVGIDTNLYRFNGADKESDLIDAIKFLNNDETVDGILVQLPLPDNFDTDKIINLINPNKDVDGFSPESLKKLSQGQIISPVFQAIFTCLNEAKTDLKNKTVALIGKEGIFTQNLDKLLEQQGAQVVLIKPEEINDGRTTQADIIISAVGTPHLIKTEHIKQNTVLIDIGIAKDEAGKTCGDVDAESVKDKAAWLTPVPGGIGPLTVAFALKNTLKFYKSRNHTVMPANAGIQG